MRILPRRPRSKTSDGAQASSDGEFWTPEKWPGKADQLRRLRLPDEDAELLSLRPEAGTAYVSASELAEAEFEAAVAQNLSMLQVSP